MEEKINNLIKKLEENKTKSEVILKGWWWKKFFKKYREKKECLDDIINYYLESEEFKTKFAKEIEKTLF